MSCSPSSVRSVIMSQCQYDLEMIYNMACLCLLLLIDNSYSPLFPQKQGVKNPPIVQRIFSIFKTHRIDTSGFIRWPCGPPAGHQYFCCPAASCNKSRYLDAKLRSHFIVINSLDPQRRPATASSFKPPRFARVARFALYMLHPSEPSLYSPTSSLTSPPT